MSQFFAQLHPFFVHFPIVLFVLYFLLETVNYFYKQLLLESIVFILLSSGVVFSIIAVLTGNQAFMLSKLNNGSQPAALLQLMYFHELMATITLWIFTFILVFRFYLFLKKKLTDRWKIFFIVIAFIGVIIVFQTGLFGGKLVFEYGIGTKFFK